ncbi:filamentous hemagglutinin N-terminal domain-containing protein [Providencia rettgeri]|uniref:two-partner secretion domain-containing protein n=1 Tax=Providencia TaxID=586 RepID=UPI001B3616A2|nr:MULTISPECIES: filamentous hemagglutinin N-terminal domain-containing protein [Providencia]MBQ0528776.1 filamentous hemagglutinin N-terminal domain-containing protein [Providencia rettgeri]WOB87479.1 filamentous hemagglutinin N-terminal domain-containing protein [Providencia sp. PROV040]
MKKTISFTLLSCTLFHTTSLAEAPDITKAKVINIEAPLKNNISFNTFESLSSNDDGLIFNNDINSNTKLNNKAAKLIFAEVTGTETSNLQGILGIKGQRANLVIANPNGISWKDGAVDNINSLSLIAGKFEKKYIKNKEKDNQLELQKLEDYNQLKFSTQPASQISISQQQGTPIQLSKLNIVADQIKLQNTLNIHSAIQNYISASGNSTLSPSEGIVKYSTKFKTDIPYIQGNHLEMDEQTKLTGRNIVLESYQYHCKDNFLCPQNKIDIQGVINTMSFSVRGDADIIFSDTGVIKIGKNQQALIAKTTQ